MSQAGQFSQGSGGSAVETLTGDIGGPVGPTLGNINIFGAGGIVVTGNPGTSTLTIDGSGVGTQTFNTDSGSATPAAGIITMHGAHGLNTSGAASTVTTAINNAITLGDLAVLPANTDALTVQTGDIHLSSGNFYIAPTNSAGTIGVIRLTGGNQKFLHNFSSNGGALADNVFLGLDAGNLTNSGTRNIGVGASSLSSLTTGQSNTCFGEQAGFSITSGNGNSVFGAQSLGVLTIGSQNVAIGSAVLGALVNGSNNIAIGQSAGSNLITPDSYNIYIDDGGAGISTSNRIHIGRIGIANAHTTCFIGGIYGITPSGTTQNVIINSSGQLGSTATPPFLTWSVITLNQTAVVNKGYFCNKAGTLALALPLTSSVGDIIEVTNENTALGVQFTQAAGQQILIGNTNTTLGAAGTLTSSAVGDTLKIVCYVANTIWRTTSMVGNWTPA